MDGLRAAREARVGFIVLGAEREARLRGVALGTIDALRAVGRLLLTIGFAPLLTHVATSGFLTAVVGPYGFWGMFRLIGLTLFCMSVTPSDACGVRALQIFALIGFIVTTLV